MTITESTRKPTNLQRHSLQDFSARSLSPRPVTGAAMAILRITEHDRFSAHELIASIASDQVLTAKLFRLVSSAYYGFPRLPHRERDDACLMRNRYAARRNSHRQGSVLAPPRRRPAQHRRHGAGPRPPGPDARITGIHLHARGIGPPSGGRLSSAIPMLTSVPRSLVVGSSPSSWLRQSAITRYRWASSLPRAASPLS